MKRNDSAFGDESSEKDAGLFELRDGRRGGRLTEDSFDEAGGRDGKLRTRGEEHQAGGVDPLAKLVEGKKGLRVMVPVREACSGKLASRWSNRGIQRSAFLPGAILGATAIHEPGPMDDDPCIGVGAACD
jgi:hypothetical protein